MEKEKKSILQIVFAIGWFGFAAYALIYRCIILGQSINAAPAIFAAIIGFATLKKWRTALNVVSIIILLVSYFNLIGFMLFNSIDRADPLTKTFYSIDIQYLEKRNSANFIPDKLPEDAHNVSLKYLPTLLQGTGHTYTFFEISDENIDAYVTKYSEMAMLPPFTVAELYEQENSPVLSHLDDYVKDVYGPEFHMSLPSDIRENHPNAKIYVIYSNFNWNHMYSTCFIIDEEAGLVGFTEGG